MSLRSPPLPSSYRPAMYKNSLRPIVLVVASAIAIWSLICAIPAFQDISEDKQNGQPKFAIFDIVMGSIYATACVIEVFGVIAAATQSVALARIYAMLSVVASVIIVGAGFLRVVIHFVYKNGLISECEQVAQGNGVEFRFGIWGPRVKDKLTPDQARQFCNSGWNHDSLSEILLLIFEIVFVVFFTLIAYAYYRQVADPTSSVNVSRAPTYDGGAPGHYTPAYDAPFNAPYGYGQQYAPPPGPPPSATGYGVGVDATKTKDFKDDDDSEVTKLDDPFADFDSPREPAKTHPPGTPPAY